MITDGKVKLSASKNLSRYCVNKEDDIMSFDIQWCRIAYSKFENMLSPTLKHSFYELHYTIKGSIHFTVNNKSVVLPQSYFIIIPPQIFHSTDYVEPETEKFVFGFYISTDMRYLTAALERLENLNTYKSSDFMNNLINMMMYYTGKKHPASSEIVRNLCECLIIDALEQIVPAPPEKRDANTCFESDNRVEATKTFIENNIMLGISYHDVASHLNLSARQLNRDVKNQTGCTIEQLINAERVKYIKSLLRSNKSLAEIAEEVGFSTEYSMSRFFKRYEGISIGTWRLNIKK